MLSALGVLTLCGVAELLCVSAGMHTVFVCTSFSSAYIILDLVKMLSVAVQAALSVDHRRPRRSMTC